MRDLLVHAEHARREDRQPEAQCFDDASRIGFRGRIEQADVGGAIVEADLGGRLDHGDPALDLPGQGIGHPSEVAQVNVLHRAQEHEMSPVAHVGCECREPFDQLALALAGVDGSHA